MRTAEVSRTDHAPAHDADTASASDGVRRIPVFVVVPPRLLLLDIAGPLEVLRQANRVQSLVRFEVRYVGPTSSLQTSIGITLAEIEPLPEELPPQSWVVIAGDVEYVMLAGGVPGPGKSTDDETAEKAIVTWLKATVRPGHKLISICTGALIAARAGLLDGHSCTTHYLSYDELRVIAPRARILENRLYVEDGERYSSAGITAGIDLCCTSFINSQTNPARWPSRVISSSICAGAVRTHSSPRGWKVAITFIRLYIASRMRSPQILPGLGV